MAAKKPYAKQRSQDLLEFAKDRRIRFAQHPAVCPQGARRSAFSKNTTPASFGEKVRTRRTFGASAKPYMGATTFPMLTGGKGCM